MLVEPADGDRAAARWVLDDASISRIVGTDAAARGREYASHGAVLSVSPSSDGTTRYLVARVQGRPRLPYTVLVHVEPGYSHGSCTCPMRSNCKHVAAVLFAAASLYGAGAQGEWERALAGVRPREPAPSSATTPLGIQFELTRRATASGSSTHIELRPVVRGSSGRWVRGGVTWPSLRYSQFGGHRFLASQHRLLEEILALNASTRSYPYNYEVQDRVFLESFPSKRIWDILAEAEELGIALVDSSKAGNAVALSDEPASVFLDVDATSGAWVVRPVISVHETDIAAATSVLLGKPAHGVAWWSESESAVGPAVAAPLSLARLDRPLDAEVLRLFTEASTITIPASDQERFLREFYPGLRRSVRISSRNASFEHPRERTQLSLVAHHAPGVRVELEWSWTHSVGAARRQLSLWGDDSVEALDAAVEHRLLAAVHEHTIVVAGLYEDSLQGRRLAARSTLTDLDAIVFTRDILPALRDIDDVDVREIGVATEYREAIEAPVITLTGKQGPHNDWFDLAVTVSVGSEDVPFHMLFVALAENRTHLILPSGTYFSIDRPELRQLRSLIAEARSLLDPHTGSARLSRFQSSLWSEIEKLGIVSAQAAAWSANVRRLENAQTTEHAHPQMLQAILRPYQDVGFNWLAFLHENRLGGVLADDMGLGKTVQAIALIGHAREHEPGAPPFLVVAPTSVVGNWVSECHRFAPALGTIAVVETARRRGTTLRQLSARKDVVVTSYALFRIEFQDYARQKWSGLILDEAQAVKNHQSRGYQCARKLDAPFKLAITGTPMENNLMELWSMFSITTPGLFPDPRHFAEQYQIPIERDGSAEALGRLQRRMRPLLLRRTKEQVAADLPEKLEQVIELELNPRHRRVYQRYLQRERQKVLGLIGDMNKNRFEIFRSLTLLRQVSIDPSLVDSQHRTVPSTKLDAFMERIVDVIAEGHRALVFSQFTRFLRRVRNELDSQGIGYCYLDGATRNRPVVLNAFKTGDAPVFLISLKAGGVGLNLAEADYCFLLDPWWNPATEAQAVDRAHRIGQTRQVMVYRLVVRDTIEEKVMALKARKQALFSSVIDGGGANASALTAADIRALLA
jgi:superfamily II DNA or RNA helicase